MATNFFKNKRDRLKRNGQPCSMGEVLNEYFRSDEPLAKGYRKFLASEKSSAEKGGEV